MLYNVKEGVESDLNECQVGVASSRCARSLSKIRSVQLELAKCQNANLNQL